MRSAVRGVISDGFTITWLPAASAPTIGESVSSTW